MTRGTPTFARGGSPRRGIRLTLALAGCAALLGCGGGGPTPPEPPPAPVQPEQPSLPAGVYALAGTSPELGEADLEPLRAIVGDARFVGLGESTHTSAGYYEMKVRLIRFMVERMGFRAIAFETPWRQALPATRYVETCVGTPEAAMGGFFRVWHDANVRDLLRFGCEWNREHPGDPVTFFGMDIQEPWSTAPAVEDFVARAAPADTARARSLHDCLGATYGSELDFLTSEKWADHEAGRRDDDAHRGCLEGIDALEGWISANAAALAATTSAVEVEEARIALVSLRSAEESYWDVDPVRYQARDRGMAELTRRLQALYSPGGRTIVWAWNWHIARRYDEVRGVDGDSTARLDRHGSRAMGSHLHDALGADYLPIALIGYRVRMSIGFGDPPIPTGPTSVEWRLQQLGPDPLLVDLRTPLPDTLLPAGRRYGVSQEWADPYRQFGALLFLENSPPMTFITVGGG